MGFFDSFRSNGFPPLYGPMKTPVTADVLEAGFLYAIAIVAFSFLLVVPGQRGKEGLYAVIRALFAIFITGSIMLCNFGQEWEVAHLTNALTAYKTGFKGEIHADIGLKIGLRSVNITLLGVPKEQELDEGNETIDYNERFSWDNPGWTQGRNGFGPFAGRVNQEFRAAQYKGLPYPILWIAEYFTLDGEGLRWGRHYRQAGYYAHILCWLALPVWIVTMILLKMYITYAAGACILTGSCLLGANIIFAFVRNANPLVIHFDGHDMEFHWGWSFWLCLIVGIICLVIGLLVLIVDLFFKEYLATFLNVDVLNDYEEYYTTMEELAREGVKVTKGVPTRSKREPNGQGVRFDDDTASPDAIDVVESESSDEDYIYENPETIARAYRRRGRQTQKGLSRVQRSRKNKSRHHVSHDNQAYNDDDGDDDEEEHDYANVGAKVLSIMPPSVKKHKTPDYSNNF